MRKKISEVAFNYLNSLKSSHSKVQHIKYKSLEKQSYISNNSNFSIKETQLLFKLRTRMLNVKANFRNQFNNMDISCNLCDSGQEESQFHLLECQTIIDNCPELYDDVSVEYDDMFRKSSKQLKLVKLFQIILDTREKLKSEDNDINQD